MKTLSAEMEICRQSKSHDVVWLVEVDWDGDVGRYSSRPVTVGAQEYRPIVAAIEGLRLTMPPETPDGDGGNRAVKIELVNTSEEGSDRFENIADEAGVEGRTVRVGFVFLDPDVVLDSDDIVWIQTYRIEAVVLETAKALLHLRESPLVAGRRLVGRRLLPDLATGLSAAAAGRMIPLVFGRVQRCPLIPFRVGRRSYLRDPLEPDDTTVAVEDASIFPDSGIAQIGDEMIAYMAVDRAGGTLGRSDSPVVRTAPAHHRSGIAVDWIPEDGFEYLVADHPCRSVGPIRTGDRMVDSGSYVAATEQVDGREVQKVVFPTLPTEVSYGAAAAVQRIDGREDVNLWGTGSQNAAKNALSAVDGSGPTTAAVVGASQTPLEIEYLGDLSAGQSQYGKLLRGRLVCEFSASKRWSVTNEIAVVVGIGSESVSLTLNRPPLSENVVSFPAHSHADTIRDELADTRSLFEIAEQSAVVNFDRADASAGRWAECGEAIDGNLDSWTENTPSGGPKATVPLSLHLLRPPVGAGDAVDLEAIEFHVRLASEASSPVMAALDAAIAGKFVESWSFEVGATPQDVYSTIDAGGLSVEDLTAAATEFAVRSIDGRHLRVYGAWLRLRYRPRIVGREQTAKQTRSGSVAAAAPLPVALPTNVYRQEFDITEFVEAHGGWGFFAPQSSERPFVRVSFGSSVDATTVRVSAIAFDVEYAPRTSVEVFDRFDADVEGLEVSGSLVESPADIIEWLVTNEAGLGWNSETLDATSFAQARTWLDARQWRLSRRIGAPAAVASLLEEVAQEGGCRLVWEAGRFRLQPLPTLLLASDAVATVDKSLVLSAPLRKRGRTVGEIVNNVRLRYGAGYGLDGGERRTGGVQWIEVADAGSAAAVWGRSDREMRARWLASGSAELATRMASLWLARLAQPQRTVEIDLPLSQTHLERGDVVVVDHPASRLEARVGEVVGVELVDGRYVRATVALQTHATYCWYGDAETFIADLPGQSEKMFVVEGVRAASLDRTGRLRLRDQLVEEVAMARAMSEAVEHDSGEDRIYFGVGSAGQGYEAVFAVDVQGRLLVRGTVRERVDLSSLVAGACHESEATRFLFSCDLTSVLLAYDAQADRLDLAGAFVEQAPV